MGTVNSYIFRVTPRAIKGVYRDIRIDGCATLDELSNVILKSYDFDPSRQYMFSTNKVIHDKEGYYHPKAVEGRALNAGVTVIDSLNLSVWNKLLYLYDFGTNWIFDITVCNIEKVPVTSQPCILERAGDIDPYGYDHNPDEGLSFLTDMEMHPVSFRVTEDEYSMYENLLQASHAYIHYIVSVLGDNFGGDFNSVKTCKNIVKALKDNKGALFNLINPDAFLFLKDLYFNNAFVGKVNRKTIMHLYLLGSMGFIDVSIEPTEKGDRLIVYVPKDSRDFKPFLQSNQFIREIDRRLKLARALNTILDLYGIVDDHMLMCRLKTMFGIVTDPATFTMETIFPQIIAGNCFIVIHHDVTYLSRYNSADVLKIFKVRDALPFQGYRLFENEDAEIIKEKGIRGVFSCYEELFDTLISLKGADRDFVKDVLDEVIYLRCMGTEKFIVMSRFDDKLKSLDIPLKVQELLSILLDECPMHMYRGYTYIEYRKLKNLSG